MLSGMERAEFEQRFLALVSQTDVVITAANVAYHLGLPIDEVQEHLLGLELSGVLQQQTDAQGNATYAMPNRPTPGTLPARLSDGSELQQGEQAGPPGVHDPAALAPAPMYGGPTSAPARGRNINGLVLNVIIPGLGSLVCGRRNGWAMIGLVILAIVLFIVFRGWSKLLGIVPLLIAWLWSLVAGIGLLDEREPPPGRTR
jgi:hypothetical protein